MRQKPRRGGRSSIVAGVDDILSLLRSLTLKERVLPQLTLWATVCRRSAAGQALAEGLEPELEVFKGVHVLGFERGALVLARYLKANRYMNSSAPIEMTSRTAPSLSRRIPPNSETVVPATSPTIHTTAERIAKVRKSLESGFMGKSSS
jgi:hypothetical protein